MAYKLKIELTRLNKEELAKEVALIMWGIAKGFDKGYEWEVKEISSLNLEK